MKMKSLGWALFPLAAILIRRGDHTRGEVAWRGHHVKKQQEGGHLRAKERASEETSPAGTLILDVQPPNCEKIHFCSILLWLPYETDAVITHGKFPNC